LNFLALRVIIGFMDDLLLSVRRYGQRYDLFRPGETVVVGVSGGPDSLCLLHLLRRLAPELGLRLHVAHLHHGLRGADADADARFVAGLAANWGLPCTVGQADVAGLAAEAGLSLEEAARQARYRFLAEVAEGVAATTIAVGHNADDQAETVLMHFLRGSGVAGLRGMLPRARLGEYRLFEHHPTALSDLWLVRPLLSTPRSAIEAYCAAHGLRPRFDRSNEDTTLYRNRLRHELLPILETYNPQIREVLAHTAGVLAGDYELLQSDLEAAWARVVVHAAAGATVGENLTPALGPVSDRARPERGGSVRRPATAGGEAICRTDAVHFDLAAWRALPIGLQRATVREAIYRLRRSLRNVNWEHVEAAVWLARGGATGQRATLAAGLELQIGYRTLRIAEEGAPWAADVPQITAPLILNVPGITELPGGRLVVVHRLRREELPNDFAANADPWTAYLDAETVGPELTLHPRQPGDRFQPQGLGGHNTRLTEFMINVKVPKDARAGWPLLIGKSGIAWVCGLRVDERAVVRPTTRDVWRVTFVTR
jgi:tRNA(Ile)-lysidine synthase